MKKILKYVYFVVIAVLLLSAIGGMMHHHDHEHSGHNNEKHEDKPIVKIGISIPLTGELGQFGQTEKESMLMAYEKWQAKDTKYDYKLIIEDNQYKPRIISMTANKLLNMDKVNAVMSLWGTAGAIFSNLNNNSSNPIPHITSAWGDKSKQGLYNFNNDTNNKVFAETMVKKFKEDGVKNLGIVIPNMSESFEMKATLIDELQKNDINIVFDEAFSTEEKNYRTFLSKIKNKPVDLIYVQLAPDGLDLFSKQRIETKTDNIPLTTINMFSFSHNKDLYKGYWEIVSDVDNAEFDKKILERNPNLQLNTYSGRVYDNMDIMISAFENAEAEPGEVPTSEAVLKELQSFKTWDGISGHLTFEPDGQINSKAKVVYY